MNIKHILCPIDFSQYNQQANEYASMLAALTGAKITYLNVHLPESYGTPPDANFTKQIKEDQLQKLREFIQPAKNDICCDHVVEFGLAAKEVVDFANGHNIDLIIMGTHGRSGVLRALMGSVAEAILRKSKCPVMAIKSTNTPSEAE